MLAQCECGKQYNKINRLMIRCKQCTRGKQKAYRREWRKKNKHDKEYNKNYLYKWRKINKSKVIGYRINAKIKHKNYFKTYTKEYLKKYRAKYKNKLDSQTDLEYQTAKIEWYFRTLSYYLKSRKYPSSLTIKDLIELWNQQSGKCALSGLNMVLERHNLKSASIDRINCKGNYTIDNVQLVCKWANFAKNNSTNEELKQIIEELQHASP